MDKRFTMGAAILTSLVALLTVCTFLWNIAVGMTNMQNDLTALSERSEYTIGVLDGRTDTINDMQKAVSNLHTANESTLEAVQELADGMLKHKFTNHNHIVLQDPDGVTIKIPMERIKL